VERRVVLVGCGLASGLQMQDGSQFGIGWKASDNGRLGRGYAFWGNCLCVIMSQGAYANL
jgi:hypothetical protein